MTNEPNEVSKPTEGAPEYTEETLEATKGTPIQIIINTYKPADSKPVVSTPTTKDESEKVKKSFVARHPYLLATAAVALTGIASTIATSRQFSPVVEGVVLEEKYVPSTEKFTPDAEQKKDVEQKIPAAGHKLSGNYMLNVKVYEPAEKGTIERLCTFYVKEEKDMPIAVLDEVLSSGSTIFVRYYDSGPALHDVKPLYPIGCFGTVNSTEIKVVHPWESSEVVKKSLEGRLEEVRQQEIKRARSEVNDAYENILF